MIKKVKFADMFVNPEKEITSKKDGKTYHVCNVNCKVSDDTPEYAGRYMQTGIFGYVDKVDATKNKSATDKAEYFKTNNSNKDVWVDVTERSYVDKEGMPGTALDFKSLSKKELEVLVKAGVIK